MVQQKHPLPRIRRCQPLKIPRSSSYYQPNPIPKADLALMKLIDRIHLDKLFLGSRRMPDTLAAHGRKVDRKRVQRLMRLMGIQAIHPGPRTSKPYPQHQVYPYRLRGLKVHRANQFWASDVTYIPMAAGFVDLTVIMDWYSRKVLSRRASNSLDAVEEATHRFGVPEICNTDQGSQYTSADFTGALKGKGIDISMDGRGAWRENVLVERLWRLVKHEEVYLNAYESLPQARQSLAKYFRFYNHSRKHQALNAAPDQVYYEAISLPEAA